MRDYRLRQRKQAVKMEYSLYAIDRDGALSQLEGLDFDVRHDRTTTTTGGPYKTGIAISPDGRYLATSGFPPSGDVIVLSLVDFSTVATFDNWGCFGDGLAFSPDSSTLAVVRNSSTQGLTLIDTTTWQEISGVPQIQNTSARGGVAFSPDGLRLGVGFGTNDFFKVYNLADWSTAFQPYLGADINTCDFSPDGSLLAVGGAFGLRVFNASYQLVFSDTSEAFAVRFSPDGTQLAADIIYYLKVYSVDSWAENLSVNRSGTQQSNWSPDGRFLASTFQETPYVRIYDGLTRKTGTAALATAGKQCAWLPNINRPRRNCVLKDHDGNPLSLPVSLLNRETMARIGRFFPDAVSGEFTAVAHTDGDIILSSRIPAQVLPMT